MGRLFAKFAIGGAAGILAWMICEPAAPRAVNSENWNQWEQMFVLVLGSLVGLAVGGLDGYTRGGKRHTTLGLVLGLVFGAIGMSFGHGLGSGIVRIIFGNTIFLAQTTIFAQVPARVVAFIPMGLFLGAAIGGSSLTMKRAIQGAIGGGIGAAIAGVCFDPVSFLVSQVVLTTRGQSAGEVGTVGRALFSLLLGAGIGLFIGLVERYSRSAWLRLSLGRNEGKEWSIDTAQTFIGRSEGAQVPLFGDSNVAQIHASIQRQGPNYVLVDGGSPIGTFLNGQRIQQALLTHGSQIQIGSFILQFLMKNQPAPNFGPERLGAQGYPMGQPYAAAVGYPSPGGTPMAGQPMPQPSMPTQVMPGMSSQPYGQPGYGQPTQAIPSQSYAPPSQPPQGYSTQVFPNPSNPGPLPSHPTIAYGGGQPPTGGYCLLATDGPMVGQRFPIGGPLEIGREGAGVRMAYDTSASRRHAVVALGPSGLTVQDLGSTNGTYVNGQRVTQSPTGPGDLIKVGSTTFRVEQI